MGVRDAVHDYIDGVCVRRMRELDNRIWSWLGERLRGRRDWKMGSDGEGFGHPVEGYIGRC